MPGVRKPGRPSRTSGGTSWTTSLRRSSPRSSTWSRASARRPSALVLVVGRDAGQLGDLQAAIGQLRASGEAVKVLFLDASDEVLVRRFEGTRRRHPLGQEGVLDAIADERRRLEAIKEMADVVVDTSELNVNQLRERLADLFGGDEATAMQILVMSFGFKHGVPIDVDNVLDVRFLPNPHWVDEMRPLTGLDEPVRRYVLGQPEAKEFLERAEYLLEVPRTRLCQRGQELPDDRDWVYRRPAPQRRAGRGDRRPPPQDGLQPEHDPPGRRALSAPLCHGQGGPHVVALGGGHGLAITLSAVSATPAVSQRSYRPPMTGVRAVG